MLLYIYIKNIRLINNPKAFPHNNPYYNERH